MRTPEEVHRDFAGRREGILRALTGEFDQFYLAADPQKENLCLYGHPNSTWSVELPAEEVPPETPEPSLGINFARDGMSKKDWLALVAVHSDTWLLAVAFYHGARLNREGRERLFELINTEPTCYEIVIGKAAGSAPVKPKRSTSLYSDPAPATRQPPRPSRPAPGRRQRSPDDNDEGLDSDEDDEGNDDQYADGEGDPCPNCGRVYRVSDFWIQCDYCNTWYDGKCVGMSQAKADRMGSTKWKCPACERRAGH